MHLCFSFLISAKPKDQKQSHFQYSIFGYGESEKCHFGRTWLRFNMEITRLFWPNIFQISFLTMTTCLGKVFIPFELATQGWKLLQRQKCFQLDERFWGLPCVAIRASSFCILHRKHLTKNTWPPWRRSQWQSFLLVVCFVFFLVPLITSPNKQAATIFCGKTKPDGWPLSFSFLPRMSQTVCGTRTRNVGYTTRMVVKVSDTLATL